MIRAGAVALATIALLALDAQAQWQGVEADEPATELRGDAADRQIVVRRPPRSDGLADPTVATRSPLLDAAETGDLDTLRHALDAGEAVDTRDDQGRTPLMVATAAGHEAAVALLLAAGADPAAIDASSNGTLAFAAAGGPGVAWRLLEAGAPVDTINAAGHAPLRAAALLGHTDIAALLLEHGADVGRVDTRGRTPLGDALLEGHLDTAALLHRAGARLDPDWPDGPTLLAEAAGQGQLPAVRFLLDRGVEPGSRGEPSPLHRAIDGGHVAVVEALARARAVSDEPAGHLDRVDAEGLTPLQLAARSGALDAVETLVEHGAPVDGTGRESDRSTPLLLAAGRHHVEVARGLLDHGAEVDARKPPTRDTADVRRVSRPARHGRVAARTRRRPRRRES